MKLLIIFAIICSVLAILISVAILDSNPGFAVVMIVLNSGMIGYLIGLNLFRERD